ncbi:MAG: hypothetical protein Q8K24_08875 [Hydrogenophaga sp.]|nr:hypothetical protein [Hydrogenophaga sp.]
MRFNQLHLSLAYAGLATLHRRAGVHMSVPAYVGATRAAGGK